MAVPMARAAPTGIAGLDQILAQVKGSGGSPASLGQLIPQSLSIGDGAEKFGPKVRRVPIHFLTVDLGDQPGLLTGDQPRHHPHQDVTLVQSVTIGQDVHLKAAMHRQLPVEHRLLERESVLSGAWEKYLGDAEPISTPFPVVRPAGYLAALQGTGRDTPLSAGIVVRSAATLRSESAIELLHVTLGAHGRYHISGQRSGDMGDNLGFGQ